MIIAWSDMIIHRLIDPLWSIGGSRVKPFICCLVDFLKSCYSTRETPTVSEVCFKDRQPKLAMLQCSGTNYVGKPSKGSCYLTSKSKCREGYFDDAKVSIQYYRYMNRWRSSMRSFFNSSKYKWTRCCKITTKWWQSNQMCM